MGEFGNNSSYNSADQMQPREPNPIPESNNSRFNEYIQPSSRMLQGGVVENAPKSVPIQTGITESIPRSGAPLQGNVQDSQLSAGIDANGGIPTYCLRIEDQSPLNRDVLRVPTRTGYHDYHNVFMKQSDYAVVQRAKAAAAMGQISNEQVNLYDDTGHLIQPAPAVNIGGYFSVNYKPSTVVLNLYDSPGMNNAPSYTRHNSLGSAAIPGNLKQKYEKAKPFIQGLLRQLR